MFGHKFEERRGPWSENFLLTSYESQFNQDQRNFREGGGQNDPGFNWDWFDPAYNRPDPFGSMYRPVGLYDYNAPVGPSGLEVMGYNPDGTPIWSIDVQERAPLADEMLIPVSVAGDGRKIYITQNGDKLILPKGMKERADTTPGISIPGGDPGKYKGGVQTFEVDKGLEREKWKPPVRTPGPIPNLDLSQPPQIPYEYDPNTPWWMPQTIHDIPQLPGEEKRNIISNPPGQPPGDRGGTGVLNKIPPIVLSRNNATQTNNTTNQTQETDPLQSLGMALLAQRPDILRPGGHASPFGAAEITSQFKWPQYLNPVAPLGAYGRGR